MKRKIIVTALEQHLHPSGMYMIRKDKWQNEDGGEVVIKERAYTLEGDYIGPSHMAYELIVNRRIVPEKITSLDFECAIGFCKAEQAWYGWTAQNIAQFAVNTPILEDLGDFGTETNVKKIPVKRIKTLKEARERAIAFVREKEEASKPSLQILQEGGDDNGLLDK